MVSHEIFFKYRFDLEQQQMARFSIFVMQHMAHQQKRDIYRYIVPERIEELTRQTDPA